MQVWQIQRTININNMTKEVFIIAAKRTPIGSFGGSLSSVSATDLGAHAAKSAIEQSGVAPDAIDEVYFGNVISANLGQAPARQVALGAGLPTKVPCTTINKVCSSGLKSVIIGAQTIQSGTNQVVLAGGTESMSNIPYYVAGARWGMKYGNGELVDGLQKDGLTDAYDRNAMGVCADATASKYGISRESQDAYAIRSYQRVAKATEEGHLSYEIAAFPIPQRKGDPIMMSQDEEYKNVKFDKIPGLRAVFTKDGTVTAANASTINDGAAALILADGDWVKANGATPIARILAHADAAQEPQWFTTAPVKAAELALQRAQLTIDQIDYFEVNEAFAVVAQAFIQAFNLDEEKVNVFGGAVALGHPLGASGARIMVTLLNVLRAKNGKYGLAAICNGGGGASSIIVENLL
jgi:acetyl-CoA C-acetyltransferase